MSKLIAVSDELYRRLSMKKREGQSFTKVISDMMENEKGDISGLFGKLQMSDRDAEEWKNRIKEDRRNFFKGRKHADL